MSFTSILILNTKINTLKKKEVLLQIHQILSQNNSQFHLTTTNPEFILEAQKNKKFQNIINNSWLSVPDGYGILLATKYIELIQNKKNPLPKFLVGLKVAWWGITRNKILNQNIELITGADLVPQICKETKNQKIFLLGGWNNTANKTAQILKEKYPHNTYTGTPLEVEDLIQKINNFTPDILFVALNHPQAQTWIEENLPKLPSVKLAIGVGGTFDYISGKVKRAPQKYLQSYEWLYRLIHQPRRFKRIFRAVIIFPFKVFLNSIK
jgi:N-acetylglucosaminyldiphosphoundecaprenol N-acetyl-beta-D-mannosaminyltransferase